MKAIGLDTFGGPEVLHLVDIPKPAPAAGEVLVRVHSVPVNPTDITFRSGGRSAALADVPPPYIPGIDFAGTIESLGANVDGRLSVGDHVVGYVVPFGPRGGTYAEYITLSQDSVTMAPAETSFDEASVLILNAVTADLALDALDLAKGDTVVVTGAAGAVGGYVIQLAKHRGYRVFADANQADHDLVVKLGADEILERGDTFADSVHSMLPEGAAALIDAASLNERALPALADNGTLVSLKGWNGPTERGITVVPVSSFGAVADTARFAKLVTLADDGVLTMRVARTLPFAEAREAHKALAAGGLRGRIVLEL
jgi:NADPH:quinone reductase